MQNADTNTMEENRALRTAGAWRWQTVSIAMFIIGILSIGPVIATNYVWERQVRYFIILNVVTDLRKELTTLHLWLEQYMLGDTTINPEKTRAKYFEASDLCERLLKGGTNQFGINMPPLEDQRLRSTVLRIIPLIDKLQEISLLQLRDRSTGLWGSANNKEFDRVFREIASLTGELEGVLEKEIMRTMEQFRQLYKTILIAWLVIVSGATIGLGLLAKRRKRSEEELQASEEQYRSLVDSTEDSIYLVDSAYNYLFINKKHRKRLGLNSGQNNGNNYGDLHTPAEMQRFRERVDTVFSTGESAQYEHRSLRDGRYFLQTLSPVKNSGGKTTAVTIVSKNITERKQMEDKLRALSLTDELTGLYNRRGFFTLAEQQLRVANRLKKRLYIISADLDGLKKINDMHGHKAGDAALAETARLLRDSFRESDIIARIGGDEFVVMLIDMADESAEMILQRIEKSFEEKNRGEERNYKISISTGIAFCDPDSSCSIQQMLNRADNAMYEQKRRKKTSQ